MRRKVIASIMLFIIGAFLYTFSIELPVLGYKKLKYIEEEEEQSVYQIINYSWNGEVVSQELFDGNPKEALEIFQKQDRIQKVQVLIVVFALMPLALWWAKEKRHYLYGSMLLLVLLIIIDITLVNKFS